MSVWCQGARVGESPGRAVRVAWERYVGEIGGGGGGGGSPTFLHADLTLRADPAVSAQFEKKTKRPSTVARVHTTHTTRAMRAFEHTPDMACLGVQNERSDKLVQRLASLKSVGA